MTALTSVTDFAKKQPWLVALIAFVVGLIIGLTVLTVDGARLGTVAAILGTGSNDVYVVQTDDGGQVLVPALEDVIQSVDVAGGILTVDPPEGLL